MCDRPTNNARSSLPGGNTLRLDPTRMTMLRKQFLAQMDRRFGALRAAVLKLVGEENALGLDAGATQNAAEVPEVRQGPAGHVDETPAGVWDATGRYAPSFAAWAAVKNPTPLSQNAAEVLEVAQGPAGHVDDVLVANAAKWQFLTDAQKVQAFQGWLQGQIDANVLAPSGGLRALRPDEPWTGEYIESAYKKGAANAYIAAKAEAGATQEASFYAGGKDAFLKDSFATSEAVSKMQLLATRSYESLKGINAAMSAEMSRVLADGLSHGKHPWVVARELAKKVDGIGIARARTLARTEMMHAHAEGQLDSFERLGIEEVGMLAEWSTAGDNHVCPICRPLEGVVLTVKEARGLIPRHANCRCTWLPANVGEKTTGQKWTHIDSRVRDSVKAETGVADATAAREASTWVGATAKLKNKSTLKPTAKKAAAKQAAAAQAKWEAEQLASKVAMKEAAVAAHPSLGLTAADITDAGLLSDAAVGQVAGKLGLGPEDMAAAVQAASKGTLAEQVAALQEAAAAAKAAKEAAALAAKKAAHSAKIKEGMKKAKEAKAAKKAAEEAAAKAAAEAAAKQTKVNDLLSTVSGKMSPKQIKALATAQTADDKIAALLAIQKEVQAAEAAAAKAAAAVAARIPEGLPDPAGLKFIKNLPGSTHPDLVEAADGTKWVRKANLDPGHVRSEALADNLYRKAGLAVPKSGIIETAEGPIKLSEFIPDGQTLADWSAGKTKKEIAAMYAKISDGFAMDALLANHDVAGLSMDNIFVAAGKPYRIDNGGALLYRAQGGAKANFGATVAEIDTLRDAAKNANTAKLYAGLTDADIAKQVADIVARRDTILGAVDDAALRKTLAARIDYLAQRFPGQAPARQAAAKGARVAEYGIGPDTAARVKAARINGVTISGDRGDIEDLNMLAWEETAANGKKVTRLQLKVTPAGSKAIEKTLGDELKAAAAAAPTSTGLAAHPDDVFWDKLVPVLKTVNKHAADGAYNQNTLAGFETLKQAFAEYAETVKASDKAGKAMVKHYDDIMTAIDDAIDSKTTTAKFAQYTPPKPGKATQEAARKSPYKVTTQNLEFRTTKIENGYAKEVGGANRFEGTMFKIDAGDGVEVRFSPNKGSIASRKGLAFEGVVQITVPNEASAETLQKAMSTLKSLGVDAAPPTEAYEELLYLHRTIYQRGNADKATYKAIFDGPGTDEEKVIKVKEWVRNNMGIDLPATAEEAARRMPHYQPHGISKTGFGDGTRHWERWDIPKETLAKEMSDYVLTHSTSDLEATVRGILQSGGEFTATAGRVRKGIDVAATGGWSTGPDVQTGGASYLFTRISKRDSGRGQFMFKISALARQDAISYDSDRYGRISDVGDRLNTVRGYKDVAAKSGNETIFKDGLSLLDDLDHIKTEGAKERDRIIKAFKDNKVDRLPDGRAIEDVVK